MAEVRRPHPHPAVRYLLGEAEAVPAAAGAFDLALMPRVVHHIPDRARAARELARVLRCDGRVVMRTTFRERLDADVYDYWPRLRTIDERRFPGEREVVAAFLSAGFAVEEVTSFAQPATESLAEYHARLITRPQSKLTHLTTEEFRRGLARVEAAAREEALGEPRPVLERDDAAVFSRS